MTEAKCNAHIPLYLAFRSLETRAKVISEGLVVAVSSSVTVGCGNKIEAWRKSQLFKKFALKIKWKEDGLLMHKKTLYVIHGSFIWKNFLSGFGEKKSIHI